MSLSDRKRKERGEHPSPFPSTRKSSAEATAVNNLNPTTSLGGSESSALHNNRLLAGYMAYEFLTEGTLLGQKFDPARAQAAPVQSAGSHSRKVERSWRNKPEAEPNKLRSQSYAEVASLLKSDGNHIPGVVNPTELARWFQL
ncbi:uncharacterized protein LOC113765838 [Coffea eugenioides]|uniref:uncharacterized protein LOC113765838 n=1 Tax=Coffea eugenioides TaxID=49369 RepID=UPI000F614997|nr:uncharacterized protein LOC113765838 [Coffea eugenioides]